MINFVSMKLDHLGSKAIGNYLLKEKLVVAIQSESNVLLQKHRIIRS